jgi:hypothetical protein
VPLQLLYCTVLYCVYKHQIVSLLQLQQCHNAYAAAACEDLTQSYSRYTRRAVWITDHYHQRQCAYSPSVGASAKYGMYFGSAALALGQFSLVTVTVSEPLLSVYKLLASLAKQMISPLSSGVIVTLVPTATSPLT